MTYEDNKTILENTYKVATTFMSDTTIAAAQDVANIAVSLGVNVWNNFAEKEEWEKAFNFKRFWSEAYTKEGGIKDILLDLEKDFFESTFSFDNEIMQKLNSKEHVTGTHTLFRKLQDKNEQEIEKINKAISILGLSSARDTSINSAVSEIYSAGPSLFSNMFDVAFVIKKRSENGQDIVGQSQTIVFLKNDIGVAGDTQVRNELFKTENFSVRCAKISIPQAQQDTFSFKFLSGPVERASSSVSFDNSAILSVDMDANLYYLDFFQSLAGYRPNYSFRTYYKPTFENKNLTPNLINNPTYQLDVVVTSRSLGSFHTRRFNPSTEAGDWANICFVFQDVKFLGTNSTVKFDKYSEEFLTCDFEFIFKNIYTIYKNNQRLQKVDKANLDKVAYNQRLNITNNGLSTYAIVDSFEGKDLYRK